MNAPLHPTLAQPGAVSYSLMMRVRARNLADKAQRQLGVPVDRAGIERAVVATYRATGNRFEAVRTLHHISRALHDHASGGAA